MSNARRKKNILFGGFSAGNQTSLTDSQFGFTQRNSTNSTLKSPLDEVNPIFQSRSTSREDVPDPSSNENDFDLRISPSPLPQPFEPMAKRSKKEIHIAETLASEGVKRGRGRPKKSVPSQNLNSIRRSTQIVPDSMASRASTDYVAETQTTRVQETPERDLIPTTLNRRNEVKMEEDDFPLSPALPNKNKTTSMSIGLLNHDLEKEHVNDDYLIETELDYMKRQDVIVYKDLCRKDKQLPNIIDDAVNVESSQENEPRVKKFKKAKQGRFYYGNDDSNSYYANNLVVYKSQSNDF